MKGIMKSSAGARALESQFDDVDESTPPEKGLTIVDDPPNPLADPLFRYVFLGFVSLFLILALAAFLSF